MRRLGLRLAPFIHAILLVGLTASASFAGGLIRLTDRDDLFGWEAVGRVELGGRGYCTGVLIASNLVLTAAHCVYDSADNPISPDEITFRAGLRDGVSIAERGVSRLVASKNYTPGTGLRAQNIRHDVALLELSNPIPTTDAAPFVLHERAITGSRVSVVSYGRGRDDALSWQRDCGILAKDEGIYFFDCNISFGSSGSPVFYKDGYRARILSLMSGGLFDDGVSVMAVGMELPAVVSRLKRDLRALPATKPTRRSRDKASSRKSRSRAKSRAKFSKVGGS